MQDRFRGAHDFATSRGLFFSESLAEARSNAENSVRPPLRFVMRRWRRVFGLRLERRPGWDDNASMSGKYIPHHLAPLTRVLSGVRVFAASVACFVAVGASASTNYVSKGGSDSFGNGTSGNPWASITNALAKAAAGDLIRVAGGVYAQPVSFSGKSQVTIQGGYDGSWNWVPVTQKTVISGNASASPVLMPPGALSNTLSYLTLTGSGNGGTLAKRSGQPLR